MLFLKDNMPRDIEEVILLDTDDLENLEMDVYFIEEITIQGDILNIIISYTGGCEKHYFKLVTSSNFTIVNQICRSRLILSHDANGDMCKRIVEEHLYYDLSPLKKRYQKTYQSRSGILFLLIRTFTLEYVFKS